MAPPMPYGRGGRRSGNRTARDKSPTTEGLIAGPPAFGNSPRCPDPWLTARLRYHLVEHHRLAAGSISLCCLCRAFLATVLFLQTGWTRFRYLAWAALAECAAWQAQLERRGLA